MSIPAWFANGFIREIVRQVSCSMKFLPPSVVGFKPLLYIFIFSQVISNSIKAGENLREVIRGTINNYKFLWWIIQRGLKDISLSSMIFSNTPCLLKIVTTEAFKELLIKEFGPNYNSEISIIVGIKNNILICPQSIVRLEGMRTGDNGLFQVLVNSSWGEFRDGIIEVTFTSNRSKESKPVQLIIKCKFG